jgi:predicted O-linked N-acetylglucosamine transferase (SPINDLY family)
MDYRLTDRLTDPAEDAAHEAFTEQLVYLPTTNHCFCPLSPLPDVAPSPVSGGNPLTFGSFSSPMKLNHGLLQIWALILQSLPASRLLIKHEQLATAPDRAHLAGRAAAAGIPSHQLLIEPPATGIGALPGQYARVDIALDTAPYTGTTTVCEALLMGVPVITLRGNLTPGRVGSAILTMAGLGELIATTPEQYQRIALQLAADLPRLQSLRTRLRSQVQASPLCDERAFARDLGETLLALRPGTVQ